MKKILFPLIALGLFLSTLTFTAVTPSPAVARYDVYVGTYTRTEGHVDGKADGIYRMQIDEATGQIKKHELVAELVNPSFLEKVGNNLYAVSELAQAGEKTGYVHAYAIRGKKLKSLGKLPTNGRAPCHVSLDRTGQLVFVANYLDGVAMVYRRDASGQLSVSDQVTIPHAVNQPDRQPWLHSVNVSPDNQLVAIADKGLDKVWLFQLDVATGRLRPHAQAFIALPAGSGPRHATWSEDGQFLYVINELSNTVSVVHNRENKEFRVLQDISTLPEDFDGASYCADLHLSPSGRYLYGSNRGHNSIVQYRVNPISGGLTTVGWTSTKGDYPRNFGLDPHGRVLYAANQNTGNIAVYEIDETSGVPGKLLQEYQIPTPVCLEF
ncbi:lactonase family protein [Lewinella sp. W8]|uniref:lactonase family protein n=1 Tax=Lewinella sp. W8 TaxID=2528208 RepID=UPI00106771D6|nr:lactonase family protein [Lewinella sp. W8]MTB50781.1 beta-propeller fold lactonase family protein [Lewinella sp. W8]